MQALPRDHKEEIPKSFMLKLCRYISRKKIVGSTRLVLASVHFTSRHALGLTPRKRETALPCYKGTAVVSSQVGKNWRQSCGQIVLM